MITFNFLITQQGKENVLIVCISILVLWSDEEADDWPVLVSGWQSNDEDQENQKKYSSN